MDDKRATNLKLWNEWTRIHVDSDFYDVDGFLRGGLSLLPLEREELGDVAGKRLLHLQCHFGLDTLSLARLGAEVTGVDFSSEAMQAARRLAAEAGLNATFIESDIYELADTAPPDWDGAFDIVFVTYGALEWLSDLQPWAALIGRFLRPGGLFYLAELHPYAGSLELEPIVPEQPAYRLVQTYSYFPTGEPQRFDVEGSYADPDAHVEQDVCYGWPHPIAEVLTVLLEQGLRIESFREHPFSCSAYWPQMRKLDDGYHWLLDESGTPRTDVPFLYSLRAIKEEEA